MKMRQVVFGYENDHDRMLKSHDLYGSSKWSGRIGCLGVEGTANLR